MTAVGDWIALREGPLRGVPLEVLSMKTAIRNPGTRKQRRDVMLELRQTDGKTWVFTDDGSYDAVTREEAASK